MSTANSRQVGGSHYSSGIQHWDIVENHGIGYLEGCASKYLTRGRKKNGSQDFQKAVHYIEKLIELTSTPLPCAKATKSVQIPFALQPLGTNRSGCRAARGSVPVSECFEFIRANELTRDEGMVVTLLFTWKTAEDLKSALVITKDILENQQGIETMAALTRAKPPTV